MPVVGQAPPVTGAAEGEPSTPAGDEGRAPADLDVSRWENEGGMASASTPDAARSETTAVEKAEQDAVPATEAPETSAVDEGVAALQAAMAAPLHPAVVASLRENLIGTIDVWAEAGIAEIKRVRDLVAEHRDWSDDEIEKAGAAFAAVADCALAASRSLEAYRALEWIDRASEAIDDLGLDPADILDLNPETGNVVMNDGRRIAVGR